MTSCWHVWDCSRVATSSFKASTTRLSWILWPIKGTCYNLVDLSRFKAFLVLTFLTSLPWLSKCAEMSKALFTLKPASWNSTQSSKEYFCSIMGFHSIYTYQNSVILNFWRCSLVSRNCLKAKLFLNKCSSEIIFLLNKWPTW